MNETDAGKLSPDDAANETEAAQSEAKSADQNLEAVPRHEAADSVAKPVSGRDVHPLHLATSTFLSLLMVLGLLLLARLLVPSLVESIRYSWHRGQLRAEYELSVEHLKSVSLDSLADVSKLVSQRMGPSVVHINVRPRVSTTFANSLSLGGAFEGQGSGFVIGAEGYILTNDHVLEDGGDIEVTMSDGRKLPAKIQGRDRHTDLAVIKVDAGDLLPIEWGESQGIAVGTPVWAVGSPFGLQQTVTFGIISGKHRVDFGRTRGARNVRGGTPYGDLMQSDVALNPGNSGGPLVNSLGQVVGVNAAILGETFQGVSFSIPSRVARVVADQLIQEGAVPRGWLGVELRELSRLEKYSEDGRVRPGVKIGRFPANMDSPAKDSGLMVGDIITAFEGQPIFDRTELIRMIGESAAGSTVMLTIERPITDELLGMDESEESKDSSNPASESEKERGSGPDSAGEEPIADAFEVLEVRVKLRQRDPRL
ncbi:MAG: S1C family serine protease [Pirellulaceae bacterium]